jgi:hypothetical protein
VDVGDIRIFRTSIYGSAANRAAFLCDRVWGEQGGLSIDERLLRQLASLPERPRMQGGRRDRRFLRGRASSPPLRRRGPASTPGGGGGA